ncbi:hypothetical protein EUGRSUZ_F01876 [Eucalyptus grandis]|uniref:Uncharacterized protein n=2 Tax=Eucalyptus grandis TaxID=71139 RepID=A0ACC3KGH0_EUCGR|nr:hypothetical protein EUGRSUZ_F01876 [Eucalyptus grandis]
MPNRSATKYRGMTNLESEMVNGEFQLPMRHDLTSEKHGDDSNTFASSMLPRLTGRNARSIYSIYTAKGVRLVLSIQPFGR